MAITTQCPSCSRTLNVPDHLLGKAVRCPSCYTTFTGTAQANGEPTAVDRPAAGEAPAADTLGGPGPAPPPPPFGVQVPNLALDECRPEAGEPPPPAPVRPAPARQPAEDTRPCPYCGEAIGVHDERCRYCGEDVAEEEERPWERHSRRPVRRDCEPHRGTLILVFGILSLVVLTCWPVSFIGLIFGICAWVMGNNDLQKMHAGTMDPEGEGVTQAGKICGIIGTILDGLFVLGCLGYIALIVVSATFK